jgi:hypothetical protein
VVGRGITTYWRLEPMITKVEVKKRRKRLQVEKTHIFFKEGNSITIDGKTDPIWMATLPDVRGYAYEIKGRIVKKEVFAGYEVLSI